MAHSRTRAEKKLLSVFWKPFSDVSVQFLPGITTGRMRLSIGVKLLLIAGLGLGFRLDDWLGGNDAQDRNPQLGPRQDNQEGRLDRLIVPAFIITFITKSITNLLFPPVPLFTFVQGEK